MAASITLGLNSTGDEVKRLQESLNAAGYNLTVDGVFGEQTQAAVKKYQAANGLTESGTVDQSMWAKLNGGSTAPATSSEIMAQLQQALANPGYTPKTNDQIREQAEGEYKSYYDQLRLSAQQQQEKSDLALQQQLEGLQTGYDRQREDSAKQYRQAYSQTDRALLGRGMQRSSYTSQTLANLLQEGAEAQQDIQDAQTAAEGQIGAQRAQLAQQLAAQLGQYDASQQADIAARIRELEDQEYNRSQQQQTTQNNLALQLYNLMYQEEQAKKKKSSSGSRTTTTTPTATTADKMTLEEWMASMGITPTSGGIAGQVGQVASTIGSAALKLPSKKQVPITLTN